jgi:hypothetical protein
LKLERLADCQSATRQVANLRYCGAAVHGRPASDFFACMGSLEPDKRRTAACPKPQRMAMSQAARTLRAFLAATRCELGQLAVPIRAVHGWNHAAAVNSLQPMRRTIPSQVARMKNGLYSREIMRKSFRRLTKSGRRAGRLDTAPLFESNDEYATR